jgi:hypothetical protein
VEYEHLNPRETSHEELEEYLTKELRPVAAPNGFADRILALAEIQAEQRAPARAKVLTMKSRPRLWVPTAVAAALLCVGFVTRQTYERHEEQQARQQAEQAQQQLDSALRITGETLEETRQQLRDAGVEVGN